MSEKEKRNETKDEKEKINTEIEAAIETSLFGSVKSITIDSKTADALYAEAYKRTGIDILKNAKPWSKEFIVKFGFTYSFPINIQTR